MKKWVSLFFGTALLLSMPVSAFATGVHMTMDKGVKVNVDGHKMEVNGDVEQHGNVEEQGDTGDHAKLDGNVKFDEKVNVDVNGNIVVDGKIVKDLKIKVDGLLDSAWDKAEKIAFKDPGAGLDGDFRMMWDHDNLYVVTELKGAAKLWKDEHKPVLLSLFYNGDQQEGDAKDRKDGYVALSWPNMAILHGDRSGCLKADKVVKSFALNGDDVNVEFKVPWENKDGVKLTEDTRLGLYIKLKELDAVKPDAGGQVTVPVITEDQVLSIKPDQLNVLPLQLIASLVAGAADAADNGNGTGGNGTGSGNGTGTGNTGTGGGTDTRSGTGINAGPGSGTAVNGVSDTGVIPAAMPQTGGGGASERTD